MKKVTLHFPSLANLVQFQAITKAPSFRIIITTISIIGSFSVEEIQMAQKEYKAQIVMPELEITEL